MEREPKIKSITKLYYSNPAVQQAILEFSKNREVVPRYLDFFGKRPDTIIYSSDILEMVNKGATSFHVSEEIWEDPLLISAEMSREELNKIRKGWDLILDIDSPFFDCSKIAAQLLIDALEAHGVKNYGIKFSGSKGLHLIVPFKAFGEEYEGKKTKEMFPEWPRAISNYLINYIRKDYNKEVGKIISAREIAGRTNLKEEDLTDVVYCLRCNKPATKGTLVKLKCNVCNIQIERKNPKLTKRKLRCLNEKCPGFLEFVSKENFYLCENCIDPENNSQLDSIKNPDDFEPIKGINVEKIAGVDLVLVSSRHLFRAPYSLHEKTALSSVVIKKEELKDFSPKDANPLKIRIINFLPEAKEGEALKLLSAALEWNKRMEEIKEKTDEKKIKKDYKITKQEEINPAEITEDIFPEPIKKLLKGLKDGKKRGLFILITFFKSLNFPAEYINNRIREWNKLNEPPLKEGYIKSQINWHLRQKRNILPPNYSNEVFYKDLGLIEKKPITKNPLVDIKKNLFKKSLKKEN